MTTNEEDYLLGGWYADENKMPWKFVGNVQWGEAYYSFDLTQVWRNENTGELIIADDSGCSCPSPFEEVRVSDATRITSLREFDEAIDLSHRYDKDYPASVDELFRLRERVADLLG